MLHVANIGKRYCNQWTKSRIHDQQGPTSFRIFILSYIDWFYGHSGGIPIGIFGLFGLDVWSIIIWKNFYVKCSSDIFQLFTAPGASRGQKVQKLPIVLLLGEELPSSTWILIRRKSWLQPITCFISHQPIRMSHLLLSIFTNVYNFPTFYD